MPPRLLLRPARHGLLRHTPPHSPSFQHLRQPNLRPLFPSIYHSRRTFINIAPVLVSASTALTTFAEALPTVANSSAPAWFLIIPISAFLVRSCTTLPFTIYSRKINAQMLKLQPILYGWEKVISKTLAQDRTIQGPAEWARKSKSLLKQKRKELYARWKCQIWKSYLGVAQVPVWIVMSLTLRGMATEPTAEGKEGFMSQFMDAIPMEQSFSEGGALWFVNMLDPDQFYVMPICLSLIMYANIEVQALQQPRGHRLGRILKNIMRIVSLAVIPLTMQANVALILYWISSASYSLMQNLIMHNFFTLPKIIKPCEPRPLLGIDSLMPEERTKN